MKLIDTSIPGIKLIEPAVFEDEYGIFFESYNKRDFSLLLGREINFVQDNHSISHKRVLRGLHYQLPPRGQGKLVRVTQGEIYDVVVDIRKSSASFGKWLAHKLSEINKRQIWIPEGFSHGFLTLTESAEINYKTTNFYSREDEGTILWNDPDLSIHWPSTNEVIISLKDQNDKSLKNCAVFN